MKKIKYFYITILFGVFNLTISCSDFLDIIPDNLATIDNAFSLRVEAERFLFTCYTYIPNENTHTSIANSAGDELWYSTRLTHDANRIARGNQRISAPYMDFWIGGNGGKDLYQGIRQCNMFLDNIHKVPDMDDSEKRRWIAEVKFLKAYLHFYLLRLYGPIPIADKNLEVDYVGPELHPYREPVDKVFDYIVDLLDETIAEPYLPMHIVDNRETEAGRITRLIAMSIKAKILVYRASAFYNGTEGTEGNEDYRDWKNKRGELLFPSEYSSQKWIDAAEACKIAIDAAHEQNLELYTWNPSFFPHNLSDEIKLQISLRNSVCDPWNSELIWGNSTQVVSSLQTYAAPRALDPTKQSNTSARGNISPNMKVAELFYSKNGVPIEEDHTLNNFNDRYELQTGNSSTQYHIKTGQKTAKFNINREHRFYATFGFDGGIWYGQGKYNDNPTAPENQKLFFVEALSGKRNAGAANGDYNSVTGFYAKKMVHFESEYSASSFSAISYPWPAMRLADLYLLYAEALNEIKPSPDSDVYKWVDLIRERAGLEGVASAWSNYSSNPGRYQTKSGMRDIIQRERLIEFAMEGNRYYDMRRWKRMDEMNQITGWDIAQLEVDYYYRRKILYTMQPVLPRDYLWPIKEHELLVNTNLEQNLGW